MFNLIFVFTFPLLLDYVGLWFGVGLLVYLFYFLCLSLSNIFIRWLFISFSLIEVSGFIGIIFSDVVDAALHVVNQ